MVIRNLFLVLISLFLVRISPVARDDKGTPLYPYRVISLYVSGGEISFMHEEMKL